MWGFSRRALALAMGVVLLALTGCSPEVMNAGWTRYGNNNDSLVDWTGGDGTFSVALPDGRTAWFFSDSFMGTVNADGSRPGGQPWAHNSMVIQESDGTLSETVVDLSGGSPGHFVKPANPDNYYWVGDAAVEGNSVKLIVYEVTVPTSGGWAIIDIHLATLALPDLEVVGTPQPVSGSAAILWGRQILQEPDHTYIYGAKSVWPGIFVTYVARSEAGNLASSWEYWTGDPATGWSSTEADARPVRHASTSADVASYGSVIRHDGEYVLVGKANHTDPQLRAFVGPSPAGPFDDGTVLQTIPETGQPCGSGTLRTYAINDHPQFEQDQPGDYLISYNVNCSNFTALLLNVDFYRPRFANVTLP